MSEQQKSYDKRSSPRHALNEKIEVVDRNGGASLGYLVNISDGGFLLMSRDTLPMNFLFQLTLVSEESGQPDIELGAESLWWQPAPTEGYYWAGFQVIDLSEQARLQIERLLGEWQS